MGVERGGGDWLAAAFIVLVSCRVRGFGIESMG